MSCNNNNETTYYPSSGIQSFVINRCSDRLILREKFYRSDEEEKWAFMLRNGEYYFERKQDKELIMSNRQEINILLKPTWYKKHRIIIKRLSKNLITTSYISEDVNKYIVLKLYYDNNYNVKKVQTMLSLRSFEPE